MDDDICQFLKNALCPQHARWRESYPMKHAIRTIDLTKVYGQKTAVNAVHLTVEEGELFALLGINGAGKTTTIKMLTCLSRPTSGDALVLGDALSRRLNRSKIRSTSHLRRLRSPAASPFGRTLNSSLRSMAAAHKYPGRRQTRCCCSSG
jgi:ABC-type glutathione transport system ATPase component